MRIQVLITKNELIELGLYDKYIEINNIKPQKEFVDRDETYYLTIQEAISLGIPLNNE